MTKEAALKQWFGSFGMSAYPSTAVPEDTVFPYLTYDAPISAWEDGEVGITVNLWFYTTQESPPNAKAREISEAIGRSGCALRCDGGYIRLMRGSPFSQPLRDEADPNIKRRYINITARYYTEN